MHRRELYRLYFIWPRLAFEWPLARARTQNLSITLRISQFNPIVGRPLALEMVALFELRRARANLRPLVGGSASNSSAH